MLSRLASVFITKKSDRQQLVKQIKACFGWFFIFLKFYFFKDVINHLILR